MGGGAVLGRRVRAPVMPVVLGGECPTIVLAWQWGKGEKRALGNGRSCGVLILSGMVPAAGAILGICRLKA